MPSTPSQTPERVRLTITVTADVHATFTRLADASGMSLSRAMGEWLEDTLDAAQYTATLVEKARAAPKEVMREVHAYALGLADETGAVLRAVRERKAQAVQPASEARPGTPVPPVSPRPVIRGGKSRKDQGRPGGEVS